MNIYAKKGTKVRFTGKGGYDSENEFARKHLGIGDVYTVVKTEVGQSHTSVYLEGLEGIAHNGEKVGQTFNSVMFEDIEL